MLALRVAMRWLYQESLAKCTIHTDSPSSLQALAALQPISTIVLEILNIWSFLTTEVVIFWVKEHYGVLGNGVADQLARQVTHGSIVIININLPKTWLKKCQKVFSCNLAG
ncbi:hypothetical protein AVEN_143678-1 [Araneus ventricosus]|uniref:RNase H type-1 domain-containing protein n=1 Tax=Araneus ventricosus TaxID=182803 RepID=A0A4Y2AQ61_ARAVE|nr:hypothetical protein AVEN_143678-1 [Araneus ventricosus]